jgi:hypothetical protein
MQLADIHARGLYKSTALSSYYVPRMIAPLDVITVLNNAKVQFMLVGAHGLSGWTRKPRATEDVDVLVAARHQKKAVRALLEAFPRLEAVDLPVVTRLRDRETKDVIVDVMKTLQQPYNVALKHTHAVKAGGQTYKIPSLEMALVMKFAPMISLYRGETEKLQDAHDFRQLIETNPELDLDKLTELGEYVYPGGGAEIVEMIRRVRAGEKLIL